MQEGDDRQPPPQLNHVRCWNETGVAAVAGTVAEDDEGWIDAVNFAEVGVKLAELGLAFFEGASPGFGAGEGADGA